MEAGSYTEMCPRAEKKTNDRAVVLHVEKWTLGGVGVTENEAKTKKKLKDFKGLKGISSLMMSANKNFGGIYRMQAKEISNQTQELMRYRAIGTIEDIEKIVQFLSFDGDKGINDDMDELNRYRLIGTVEECLEAREKQRREKPKKKVLKEDLKIGCVTFKGGTETY